MEENQTVVKFDHISVQFPGVLANDDVTLTINKGEVFALVGENGAGKSTLMKVLYGLNEPTSGSVTVKGKKMERYSPAQSISMGVGMVHQHFMLVPSFTAAENIVLSREPRKGGVFFDTKRSIEITNSLIKEYGLGVDPEARIDQLSVGLQQRVEILKTLYRGADILILDEPTAVLTPQETDELFAIIRRIVKEKDMTVIIITHKLYEVMAISDRVGVMRQGKLVGTEKTSNVNERMLASMMVGREMLFEELQKTDSNGDVLVCAESLAVTDDRGLKAVRGVSFDIRSGEILGVAGIEGNGQSELAEALTGLRPIETGDVKIRGESIKGMDPGSIRKLGLAHIPEDRLLTGIASEADITENLIVGKQRESEFAVRGQHLKRKSIREYAKRIFSKFDIRAAGVDTKAGSLSGGNMQKLVVAREFSFKNTPVLIISQPTRGVDIGAIEFIHRLIIEKRNEGSAILLVSADLDEVMRLSDRILTIYEGKITGIFCADKVKKEELGFYMTGGSGASREDAV